MLEVLLLLLKHPGILDLWILGLLGDGYFSEYTYWLGNWWKPMKTNFKNFTLNQEPTPISTDALL